MFSERKLTNSEPGHEDGTINCPVGETINGPASLQFKKLNTFIHID